MFISLKLRIRQILQARKPVPQANAAPLREGKSRRFSSEETCTFRPDATTRLDARMLQR
jgi:hypothetical protein